MTAEPPGWLDDLLARLADFPRPPRDIAPAGDDPPSLLDDEPTP